VKFGFFRAVELGAGNTLSQVRREHGSVVAFDIKPHRHRIQVGADATILGRHTSVFGHRAEVAKSVGRSSRIAGAQIDGPDAAAVVTQVNEAGPLVKEVDPQP
jgi:hypothetical protein